MLQWVPSELHLTSVLAVWGAVLSTLLGFVKLWETWQARFRIDVASTLTGSEDLGHTISVRNLSGKPAILGHWEVMRVSGSWPSRKESRLVSADEYTRDTPIAAHSMIALTFRDQDHFSWDQGGRIVIRLWFAGRRPILRKITG